MEGAKFSSMITPRRATCIHSDGIVMKSMWRITCEAKELGTEKVLVRDTNAHDGTWTKMR